MSQSDTHRSLIMRVAEDLQSRYPGISIITDAQQNPGDEVPPIIDGFRPDVYAVLPTEERSIIIAEAKTDGDLQNQHTDNQLAAFLNYIERKRRGCLILSVTGRGADRAKTLLRFVYQYNQVEHTALAVYDGCDLWKLRASGIIWDLI